MKRAFTLSEALITLAIIGILASILIPVVNNIKPDKDKVTYKKALYDMQAAVSNAMESSMYNGAVNSAAYWADEIIKDDDFCMAVADSLNTRGAVRCSKEDLKRGKPEENCNGQSSYTCPNFVTTDGIRFWGLEGQLFATHETTDGKGPTRDVCIDRKMSDKERNKMEIFRSGKNPEETPCGIGMKIKVRYDGKVLTPSSNRGDKNADTTFTYENDMIDEFLSIGKTPDNKK